MCDDHIHQGLLEDPAVSRRGFGALAGGAALAAATGLGVAAAEVTERDVVIPTPDGRADAALFLPAGKGPWPAVLIWPDVVSLRPVFRDMGRRLAAEGHVVLVPNLYYRVKAAPVVEMPFNFANPADREKLAPLRASVTPEGSMRDAAAYVAFLDAQPQTDTRRKVGVQGYCMGGPLAVRTAAAAPGRIGAVASFHGAGMATDAPTSPHRLVAGTQAAYLVATARDDDAKDPGEKDRLRTALDAAGRPNTVEVYPADHGWCVKGGRAYDEAQAERAWTALLELYRKALA